MEFAACNLAPGRNHRGTGEPLSSEIALIDFGHGWTWDLGLRPLGSARSEGRSDNVGMGHGGTGPKTVGGPTGSSPRYIHSTLGC